MPNSIDQVRSTSTFESFEPQNEVQEKAKQIMQDLVSKILTKVESASGKLNFDHARLISISGKPGLGKTHLLEAFINEFRNNDIDPENLIYLSRGNFTGQNFMGDFAFDGKPIIVIDDLFSEHQSVDSFSSIIDIDTISKFLSFAYEDRRLIITSSNLASEEIFNKVKEVDEVGRVTSRVNEMMAGLPEIKVEGKDYRTIIAETLASSKDFSI